ncbi:FG-GAP-like repeat-containing protein [Streptomyces zhihengii]|uniref:VCBS repeat-containing protein n=1 Tax=Streptomyces zhihengii TaxID=1818004 RepID=A0ABS2V635_9ACTN|nr:FG-GAP-like repeat-containing protein [Streptomyces zhihengii]MBM9624834.1 VCBS repeat-containing protein [Streptomyces zhihengii]
MTRQRMTAAVAIGVAVCAATSAMPAAALPFTEATASDAAAQDADTTTAARLQIEAGSEIIGSGATGFLASDTDGDVRWTRYADGSSTVLATERGQPKTTERYGALSDTVFTPAFNQGDGPGYVTATAYDMAAGTASAIDLRTLSRTHGYIGAVGDTIIASATTATGAQTAHLVRHDGTSLTDRPVAGLPGGALDIQVKGADAGAVLLSYRTGELEETRWHLALVDLASATVTRTFDAGPHAPSPDAALSGTHVAWFEATQPFGSTMVLNVAERGSSTPPRRETITGLWQPVLNLTGNWLTYASASELHYGDPQERLALTAVPVGGGVPRKLLEQVSTIVPSPDGSLLAMGGTLAGGQGLYRIAPGTDAAPAVTQVASTGVPTAVTVLGHTVPSTIDLDENRGAVPLSWRLSRLNVTFTATIRHTRTGLADVGHFSPGNGQNPHPERIDYTWDGTLSDNGKAVNAPNGAYTWTVEAKPTNGIGPTATVTGTFTVHRKPAPHDFTDNGSPDVLARDKAGRLWLEDTASSPDHLRRLNATRTRLVGGGWQIYNSIEATGNIAGGAAGDLVARDTAGVLWLYQGRGDGTFTTRVKIGGGWQGYRHIAAGSDLTGDGRPDLVATDTAGALWLHRATGNTAAPFADRKKIGLSGWQTFNSIQATGNIAGGAAGDLVARDTAGVLWLYQGRGDGTFTTRVKIGAGWQGYTHLTGIGDGNRDGRPDLFATSTDGTAYYYQGTGSAAAPFRKRESSSVFFGSTGSYNHIA